MNPLLKIHLHHFLHPQYPKHQKLIVQQLYCHRQAVLQPQYHRHGREGGGVSHDPGVERFAKKAVWHLGLAAKRASLKVNMKKDALKDLWDGLEKTTAPDTSEIRKKKVAALMGGVAGDGLKPASAPSICSTAASATASSAARTARCSMRTSTRPCAPAAPSTA